MGDGAWRGRFESLTQSLGLQQHFIFTGLVPPENIPALLGIMDIVVHLSRREGLARALSQALAAGRPIVAFDCDGAREVCLDHETGFLVEAGNLELLKWRILELAENSEIRERMGAQGQVLAKERFSVEAMVESIHSLYRRLAKV